MTVRGSVARLCVGLVCGLLGVPAAAGQEAPVAREDGRETGTGQDRETAAEDAPSDAYAWPEAVEPAPVVVTPAVDLADVDDAERPRPDYDGLEPTTTAGEVLLWVPRVLFAPMYLVTEFVIRRPLGWMVTGLEEEEVPAKIIGLFTFGPEGQTLVVPVAFFEFGFRPSAGIYFRTRDFLFDGHTVSAVASFGGPSWTHFSLSDSIASEEDEWELSLVGRWTRRPDGLFYGIGPRAEDDNRARYAFDVLDATLAFDWAYWGASTLGMEAGIRGADFDPGGSCCDPDIAERVANGTFEEPPGFPEGYDIARVRGHGSVDTRAERPEPGSGVRLSGDFEYAFDLSGPGEASWVRYGGAATGFFDVSGWQHVVSLTLATQHVNAVEGEVPFTELVDFGGVGAPDIREVSMPGAMRGFQAGRLIGDSGIAAVFEYRWPIWVFLDGSFQVAAGNTFDGYLDGFELDRLRLSFTWGLKTVDRRGNSFELLVGMGTETFEDGTSVEAARLVVGTSQAF